MYRVAITPLGEERLAEGGTTPTHQALAALAAPQLEAANPRVLFDAYCARLREYLDTPLSTDECRSVWRALRDEGLIVVRGSSQVDAGQLFAGLASVMEGGPARWGSTPGAVSPAPGPRVATRAADPQDPPLIPRRVTDWFRGALAHFVHSSIGS